MGWDRATLYAAGLLLGEHTSLMMMGCGPAAETAGLEALLPLPEGAPAPPDGRRWRGPTQWRRGGGLACRCCRRRALRTEAGFACTCFAEARRDHRVNLAGADIAGSALAGLADGTELCVDDEFTTIFYLLLFLLSTLSKGVTDMLLRTVNPDDDDDDAIRAAGGGPFLGESS